MVAFLYLMCMALTGITARKSARFELHFLLIINCISPKISSGTIQKRRIGDHSMEVKSALNQ